MCASFLVKKEYVNEEKVETIWFMDFNWRKDCRILLIPNKLIDSKVVILLMLSSWKTKKTDVYKLTRWKREKKGRSLTTFLTVRTVCYSSAVIDTNEFKRLYWHSKSLSICKSSYRHMAIQYKTEQGEKHPIDDTW